jgi:hypothetical protein
VNVRRGSFVVASRVLTLGAISVFAVILPALGFAERGNPPAAPSPRSKAELLTAPLSFEPNQGQTDPEVQFLSRGSGYALFLSPGEVVLNLERTRAASGLQPQAQDTEPALVETVRMSLIGANAKANGLGLGPERGVVNYFIGNDPTQWHSGIPTFSKVSYSQIYPGVDLVFYGNRQQLEYDFVIAPNADPGRIAWRIAGARAGVDAAGDLVLTTSSGAANFKKPLLYQMEGEKKTSVEGAFAVAGDHVRFRVGNYDHSRALIIDPVLSYATYLAGSNADYIGRATGPGILQVGTSQGIAVDSEGSVYATGYTYSLDFPTRAGYRNSNPAKDGALSSSVFVTKFSPDGGSLVYSTYLGGSGADNAYAIAVDSEGSAYVTGYTSSNNFPITAGAYESVCSPNPTDRPPSTSNCNSSNASAYVTKLNPSGTGLIFSTFLGGYGWAYGTAIAVDAAGRTYIAGNEAEYCTTGRVFQGCFPTTSDAVIGGDKTGGRSAQYAFAAVFDPAGAHLLYSTIFGDLSFDCLNGCGGTYATVITTDSNGYFYLAGETQAGKLPTTPGVIQPASGPLYPTSNALQGWRGFIAKLSPVTSATGVSLGWATYLGGHTSNAGDYISGVATDSAGNLYVAGQTNALDFPVTAGAYQTVCGLGGTCSAAHLTKLNPSATEILWSTYVGGARQDGQDSIAFTGPIQLDAAGNIYIVGQTVGFRFPMVNPVEPTPTGGSQQVLIAKFGPSGSNLLFSTTLGSNGLHTAFPGGLAVDAAKNIYVAGNHIGPGLITTPGAFQTTVGESLCCYHGFVVKIAAQAPPPGAALSAQAASVAASASSGSVQITVPGGVEWTAESNAPWITVTAGASGAGNGAVSFSVASNPGEARSGTITIAGLTFTIRQESASTSGLSFAGSMAQIASADGWDSSLLLVNLGSVQGKARLNFYDNHGAALSLPFTFPQHTAAGTTLGATFDETLGAGATVILDTGPVSGTPATGWAQLLTSGGMDGFTVFTFMPTGQAATVPLETRNASSYLLSFDNTGAVSTGLAIANLANGAASVKVVVRDDGGSQIGTGSIELEPQGHNSFMLTDPTYGFPVTAGMRGVVEFDTPPGGRISVLGLRANAIPNSSGFALTTLPVLAGVGAAGGTMAHFASGSGWQTTVTLVNTGSSAATANLNFFDGKGGPVALPLSFPQTNTTGAASNVSRNIPAGGSLIILIQDPGGADVTTGSATLTTTGAVGGFAVFRFNPTGQEAVVPMQTLNAPSYILAFDNTGALSTGLAIANAAAQAATVNVIIRDDAGAQIGTGSIPLLAHGHASFMLTDTSGGGWASTAGVRGTVEFQTPSGGQIAPLGLRAAAIPGGFTITTIPVMAP